MECRKEKNYMVLELKHPPGNALTVPELKRIYKVVKMAEKQKDIMGVVLASCSKTVFSSGLDLSALFSESKWKTRLLIVYAEWLVHKIAAFILHSDKIYVAGAEGAVIGSAVTLFAACDLRIGSERTWFWIPDPQYGGLLADGGIELISHLCGGANARRMCLTNKRVQAVDAGEWGLLNLVVKQKDVTGYCESQIKRLIQYSYDTLKHTKHILNQEQRVKFHGIRIFRVVLSKEMMRRLRRVVLKEDI